MVKHVAQVGMTTIIDTILIKNDQEVKKKSLLIYWWEGSSNCTQLKKLRKKIGHDYMAILDNISLKIIKDDKRPFGTVHLCNWHRNVWHQKTK